jgi:hypothetical protein
MLETGRALIWPHHCAICGDPLHGEHGRAIVCIDHDGAPDPYDELLAIELCEKHARILAASLGGITDKCHRLHGDAV